MSTCEKGESENGRGGRTCPGTLVYFSSHCSEGGGGIKQGEEVLGNQDYKSQDIQTTGILSALCTLVGANVFMGGNRGALKTDTHVVSYQRASPIEPHFGNSPCLKPGRSKEWSHLSTALINLGQRMVKPPNSGLKWLNDMYRDRNHFSCIVVDRLLVRGVLHKFYHYTFS